MSREPKFMSDYASLWRQMPADEFQSMYRKAALIGLGVAGELKEEERSPASGTISIKDHEMLFETGTLVGRVWPVTKGAGGKRGSAISVGRAADNDVVIPEYSVSTHHCEFSFGMTGMTVVDLGSFNGTWAGDRRVEQKKGHPVKDGDVIVLGRYRFEFQSAAGFIERVKALAKL